jgi:hypothetical protein
MFDVFELKVRSAACESVVPKFKDIMPEPIVMVDEPNVIVLLFVDVLRSVPIVKA